MSEKTMNRNNVENDKNTQNNQQAQNNNYNDDKATYNFGQLVGNFGKFSNYSVVGKNNIPMLKFSLEVKNGFYTSFIPMTAWGKTADALKNTPAGQMVGIGYSLHSSRITNSNNYPQDFAEASAYTTYNQLNGYYNQGKIIGNFDKFSHYDLVGKNNTPMLKFKLSIRDYTGNFHNIPMIAWGKVATQIHNGVAPHDFIELTFNLSCDKLQLQNNHSLNVDNAVVTGGRMLKVYKPNNQSNSDNNSQTTDNANHSTSTPTADSNVNTTVSSASITDSSVASNSNSSASSANSSASINNSVSNSNSSSSDTIDISDSSLPF